MFALLFYQNTDIEISKYFLFIFIKSVDIVAIVCYSSIIEREVLVDGNYD